MTIWGLFAANVVSGIMYGASLIPFYTATLINDDPLGSAYKAFRIFTTLWVRLMSVASGVILIDSIIKIRRFFS